MTTHSIGGSRGSAVLASLILAAASGVAGLILTFVQGGVQPNPQTNVASLGSSATNPTGSTGAVSTIGTATPAAQAAAEAGVKTACSPGTVTKVVDPSGNKSVNDKKYTCWVRPGETAYGGQKCGGEKPDPNGDSCPSPDFPNSNGLCGDVAWKKDAIKRKMCAVYFTAGASQKKCVYEDGKVIEGQGCEKYQDGADAAASSNTGAGSGGDTAGKTPDGGTCQNVGYMNECNAGSMCAYGNVCKKIENIGDDQCGTALGCSGNGQQYQGPCPNGSTVDPKTGSCSTSGAAPSTGDQIGNYQGPCPNGSTVDPKTGNCGSSTQSPPGNTNTTPGNTNNGSGQGNGSGNGGLGGLGQTPSQSGSGSGNGGGNGSGGNSNGTNCANNSLVGSLITGSTQTTMTCAKNQNEYTQQQQQYQNNVQTYNNCQTQANYARQNGQCPQTCQMPTVPPSPCYTQSQSSPYGVGTDGQSCSQAPTQPNSSQCSNGSFRPISATQNGCVTGWQCVPTTCNTAPERPNQSGCTTGTWNPIYSGNTNSTVTGTTANSSCIVGWQCVAGTNTTNPQASLSCTPSVGDVGATITLAYQCTNAAKSVGSGFITNGLLSGSTSTVLTTPPVGTNIATYSLACSNADSSISAGAQCSVQIAVPKIVLVANPTTVASGDTATVGWVTSGMQKCTIASPQLPDFTAFNANNTSINGVSTTTAITKDTDFVLSCTTLGGNTKIATTTVKLNTSSQGIFHRLFSLI